MIDVTITTEQGKVLEKFRILPELAGENDVVLADIIKTTIEYRFPTRPSIEI